MLLDRIIKKYKYLSNLYNINQECKLMCEGHQVRLYNWSRPFEYDLWLLHFIEERGFLKTKPKTKIALYSIFGPQWMMNWDNANLRIFVERENLHKPKMQHWLHRYLDDKRVQLSLGFDKFDHPQYMHFPFWVMWNVFSPTATYKEIKLQVQDMNNPDNHSYKDRKFCAFLCSHDDVGRKKLCDQLTEIEKVDCDGRLFHNNDDLKTIYNDDKLEYLKHYRFNLTPENTNYEGYVTEKLFEAIQCGCIPIYHGSNNHPEPDILNQDAIIFVEMGKENTDKVTFIRELNTNEKLYMDFASQKRFLPGAEDIIWGYYEELEKRIKEMIKNI